LDFRHRQRSSRPTNVFFTDSLFVRAHQHDSIAQDEVSRLQSDRQRANDAGSNHQLYPRHQIECMTRGLGRTSMPDSVAHDRKLFARDRCAEALQAVNRERRAIPQSFLERRNLPRERIEEQNQSCGLTLLWTNA
jgi:hypothetical protein